MHALHSWLPSACFNYGIFKNKFLNAVKDVEACLLAYFKPSETVEGIICDLHSSLAIKPAWREKPALDAHFVDRHYKGELGCNKNNKYLYCIVFKNTGCWSTNRSKEKRLASLQKFSKMLPFLTSITGGDE